MKKTVVITGAAKGIGAQIAREFAKDNFNVCINYNTSDIKAQELKKEFDKLGVTYMLCKTDISNRKQVDDMIDNVLNCFGSIDVLVNNAGICEYKLFTDITNEEFYHMLNVNVIGTFNVTQSVLKKCMIKKQDGCIINISSIWGMVGASCEVSYSTSKSAIIGMSKALAKELGLSNIRVNVVAPGAIKTDMIGNLSSKEIKEFEENIPLGKIGEVEDVAQVVKFLSSDSAKYITGQVISPNGGIVM